MQEYSGEAKNDIGGFFYMIIGDGDDKAVRVSRALSLQNHSDGKKHYRLYRNDPVSPIDIKISATDDIASATHLLSSSLKLYDDISKARYDNLCKLGVFTVKTYVLDCRDIDADTPNGHYYCPGRAIVYDGTAWALVTVRNEYATCRIFLHKSDARRLMNEDKQYALKWDSMTLLHEDIDHFTLEDNGKLNRGVAEFIIHIPLPSNCFGFNDEGDMETWVSHGLNGGGVMEPQCFKDKIDAQRCTIDIMCKTLNTACAETVSVEERKELTNSCTQFQQQKGSSMASKINQVEAVQLRYFPCVKEVCAFKALDGLNTVMCVSNVTVTT